VLQFVLNNTAAAILLLPITVVMHVQMDRSSSQKSFIELFSGRVGYTMGAPLAVQKEATHERYTETRHCIPDPTIGVSVFSGFNIQRYPNASSTRTRTTQYAQHHVEEVR